MKRTLSVILTSLLAAGAVFATGQAETPAASAPQAAKKQSLTVWLKKEVNETTNSMLEARVKEFGQQNNIDLTVEFVPYEKLFPMWMSAIEAKTLPDISYFQYQEAGQFYAQNLMLDVTDLIAEIEKKNGDIIDSLVKPAIFDGKAYAVPQKFYSVALHYRKDMLAAAGYSAPPKTWDEFRAMAIKLTDPSKGIYGAGIGLGATNSDAEWLNQVMLWGLGGSLIAADSKTIVANSEKTVAALDYISSIFLKDKSTPPAAVNWDDAGNNKAFLSGQVAMAINAGTLLAAIGRDNPDLYAKTGTAPIASGPAGFFMPSAGSYLGIFNTTKNPDLAKKLIAYLYDYEWYRNWMIVEMPSIVPVFEKSKQEEGWKKELTKPFIDSMSGLCFIGYPGMYTPKAGQAFNLKLINKTLENIVVNKMTPKEAAEILQKDIQQIYSK